MCSCVDFSVRRDFMPPLSPVFLDLGFISKILSDVFYINLLVLFLVI